MHDLRFAFRQLGKSPGFTAVVVLSLALGIGAITTVRCWIENLLLRPIPGAVRRPELAVLTTSHGERMWDTSSPDVRAIAALTELCVQRLV